MLSAKLRLVLRGLAPVSFDDSILQCSTLQNKYEVPKNLQSSFVTSEKLHSRHLLHLQEAYLNRFPFTIANPTVTELVSCKGSTFVCRNKPIETKNQSCQTETLDTETNLEALSTKVDQIFHKLNCHALKSISESKIKHFPKLWLDLGELNYSPAQYNLGVWYEKQASECLSLQDGLKRHYNKQAGHWYSCAVRGDSHPLAAYNLACLILDSEEPIIHSNSSDKPFTFTVTNLMKLAADGNVKQAKKYLSEQCITKT
ncbi:uncharacterized protein DC041_0010646 [Schistosoma bovis]|uniref:Uncharacterized protein n=1 Tax=Schistosoma bovis TaxID=6184 RepID=A0A430QRA6_SCHBO|nr:uncharacterized protein DC041_0010646 [Schistosoma bovis]